VIDVYSASREASQAQARLLEMKEATPGTPDPAWSEGGWGHTTLIYPPPVAPWQAGVTPDSACFTSVIAAWQEAQQAEPAQVSS
jgi:hypothetical protein